MTTCARQETKEFEIWWTADIDGAYRRSLAQAGATSCPRVFAEESGLLPLWARVPASAGDETGAEPVDGAAMMPSAALVSNEPTVPVEDSVGPAEPMVEMAASDDAVVVSEISIDETQDAPMPIATSADVDTSVVVAEAPAMIAADEVTETDDAIVAVEVVEAAPAVVDAIEEQPELSAEAMDVSVEVVETVIDLDDDEVDVSPVAEAAPELEAEERDQSVAAG